MSDILDEVRKAEKDALSPSNRDFYKRCGDEIERLHGTPVPEGYMPVPLEPTPFMLSRGAYHCITHAGAAGSAELAQAKAVYKAMLKQAAHEAEEQVFLSRASTQVP